MLSQQALRHIVRIQLTLSCLAMSIEYIEKLPSAEQLKEMAPVPPAAAKAKAARDEEISKIFSGTSNKFLLIIGPCSAHNEDAVSEYVSRLAKIQEKTADKLVLVPRIYTNKPRTTGEGYKGVAHQADPTGEANMAKGLVAMRNMHIKAMSVSGLSAADEMLYPGNYPYLDDILSYVAVGARSVENQEHRLTVSGIDIPAGMKNPTSGDLSIMMNSVHAAQLPHDFIYNNYRVKTSGNPLAHCILRGAVNQYGQTIPNYHYEDLHITAAQYAKRSQLVNPAIVVDTNHCNSQKQFAEQPRIAMEVIRSKQSSSELKNMIRGLMIESYLMEGNQKADGCNFGQSITDPCLGWEASERLVYDIAEAL
jgi:3-deoxy-7-phosphoheptulonate synthase